MTRLSNGPSSMDPDPYEAVAADIRAAQRKLSPRYPTADEAALRLYNSRSMWVGRIALAVTVAGLFSAITGFHFAESLITAGVGFVAFGVICVLSGQRNAGERRP